jgi:hypothetical protein
LLEVAEAGQSQRELEAVAAQGVTEHLIIMKLLEAVVHQKLL